MNAVLGVDLAAVRSLIEEQGKDVDEQDWVSHYLNLLTSCFIDMKPHIRHTLMRVSVERIRMEPLS